MTNSLPSFITFSGSKYTITPISNSQAGIYMISVLLNDGKAISTYVFNVMILNQVAPPPPTTTATTNATSTTTNVTTTPSNATSSSSVSNITNTSTTADSAEVLSDGPPPLNFGGTSGGSSISLPAFYNYRDTKSGLTVKIITTIPK